MGDNKEDPTSGNEFEEEGFDLSNMLSSPAYMGATMRRHLLQEMIKSFPLKVQQRVNALKNIELERLHLEAKFYDEVIRI